MGLVPSSPVITHYFLLIIFCLHILVFIVLGVIDYNISMNKRLLIPLLSAVLVIGGTLAAIQFAKGYRPDLKSGSVGIKGTGLLVANSFPSGSQVFINGKLTTATDTTLNLPQGEYQIEIKRDGYTPWKKSLILKEELVAQTNATLFPSVPNLKPLTFTGALNPIPSPDGTKIAYFVTSASTSTKNGLWLVDLSDHTFSLDKEPRQITRILEPKFNTASITWSPDSREILLSLTSANYLLDSNRFNDAASLQDVTARLPIIFSEWEETLYRKELERLLTLPNELQQIATSSATNLYFSPDEQKLLYTATKAVTIPGDLIPSLPAESTQAEERVLEPGATYVYDLKEDKNFRVLDPSPAELGKTITEKIKLVDQPVKVPLFANEASPSSHLKLQQSLTPATIAAFNAQYSPLSVQNIHWFPTSSHLILAEIGRITIMEYDGTNKAVVYSNSFEGNFAYPWPNGSQLLLLTNLNQNADLPPNLYSLNLK